MKSSTSWSYQQRNQWRISLHCFTKTKEEAATYINLLDTLVFGEGHGQEGMLSRFGTPSPMRDTGSAHLTLLIRKLLLLMIFHPSLLVALKMILLIFVTILCSLPHVCAKPLPLHLPPTPAFKPSEELGLNTIECNWRSWSVSFNCFRLTKALVNDLTSLHRSP